MGGRLRSMFNFWVFVGFLGFLINILEVFNQFGFTLIKNPFYKKFDFEKVRINQLYGHYQLQLKIVRTLRVFIEIRPK